MNMTIYQATHADLDPVHEFMNRTFALKLEGLSLRPAGIDKVKVKDYLPENTSDTNTVCFIAKDNTIIIGMLSFSRYTKTEYTHCGDFGMTIWPEYWRQGLGFRLVGHLQEWCRANGVTKIELGVWGSNCGAIALYEKHGFVHEGRRTGTIIRDGKVIDLVLMGKHLIDDI